MTTSTLYRIEQLREMALPLEPDAEKRIQWREQVIQYTDAFINSLPDRPAYVATEDMGIGILESPISEGPIPIEQALDLLKNHVDKPGENEGTSPGYLAYIPSGGLYAAALGDYIAAVTNRFVGLSFCSPGAAHIEPMLWRWMADFVGYPATAAGDFTSGGSLANLSAIVTAREAHQLKAIDYPRAVVYLSDQTHHSVVKGLKIAGLKECIVHHIKLDQSYRMQADALETAIHRDRQAGLLPWLIVGTAGATETGAVDPLVSMADIARHNQLWLHIDGAYGAMFALCEMGKAILDGIEHADSVTMDPHKGLFMTMGTGAVLVRNGDDLLKAYRYHANYLESTQVDSITGEVSQSDLSPELTRPFRGLRLWLALKLTGVAPFRAALEEKLLLARYFYERLQQLDSFEVGSPPDLSVVMFRYRPTRGNVNEFNQKLIQAIQQDGRIYLSATKIKGDVFLRLAVLGFRTHLETIELTLEILRQKAKEIESNKTF
jgi:aromatic-L-amino-acid decarboxylase